MKKLIAYHGKQAVKKKYINRVHRHRELDHLIQGIGWESNGTTKGCAVGCTLEKYDHKAYEVELGIPEMIARLEDAIFEGLPREKAMEWPERFLKAIKPGSDLSMCGVRFLISLNRRLLANLKPEKYGVKNAIHQVLEVLEDWLKTGRPNEAAAAARAAWAAARAAEAAAGAAEAAAAARAAWAAARAAEAAAWAAEAAAGAAGAVARAAAGAAEAAAWAAEAAAWAAARAAEAAARAAEAAAGAAARAAEAAARAAAEFEWMADELIEILKSAPKANAHAR